MAGYNRENLCDEFRMIPEEESFFFCKVPKVSSGVFSPFYGSYNKLYRLLVSPYLNKAFDRVRHDEIIKELTKLKIDGKDLRIIKNNYVLGTDCSNASRRRDQCISKNKKRG